MAKIAFVTSTNGTRAQLSPHFGKARWVMVLDTSAGLASFHKNTGLTGRAVVDILIREHCEEVVFRNIGPGALKQLRNANIGGWHAAEQKTPLELADDLLQGLLRLARTPTTRGRTKHG